MSQRIPHLLTHLLTASELDTLEAEMLAKADAAAGTGDSAVWQQAVAMIQLAREASFQLRASQTPSARRRSLSYRPTSSTAH